LSPLSTDPHLAISVLDQLSALRAADDHHGSLLAVERAILALMSCLFCKIVAGEIPATRVHEDDELLAFEDIKPEAPVHVLIVPKRHIATLNDLGSEDDVTVGAMVRLAARIAKDRGVDHDGYRTVFNCNSHAGQTVFHIHLHLLAGRRLGWPPG
jgi:histidine triad (HIT) family protein